MPTLFLRAVALAAVLLPLPVAAAPLSLETALELAVQRSESARSARAGMSSAAEAARAAGQLPDPVLRVGVENLPATGGDRFSSSRDSMTMKRVGIAQEWLSSDKRAARQAAADAMAGRESVAVQIATADTRLQTALAYCDAYYASEALKLSTLMEQHAHEELEAARGRLSAASGSSQDVLALSGARGVAEDESAQLRQQIGAATLALERWVGVPVDALAPPDLKAIEDANDAPAEQVFVAASPAVLAMQRELELARREASVAAANRQPNWTWELSYAQRSGYSDMVSFGVSIPLPLAPAQRQDRETASKLALVDKAEAGLAEAARAAIGEHRMLASDARRLSERIERYRASVLVPAQQRSAAATAAYRSNQAALTAVFEARHADVEAQRRLLTLQRELARAQAQLAYKPLVEGAAR